MLRFCTGCGAKIGDDAAYCGTCGVAVASVDQVDEETFAEGGRSHRPLIFSGIAVVLAVVFYFYFPYFGNISPVKQGDLGFNDESSASADTFTENVDDSTVGLTSQLELAIERNPSFDHCGILSYYLAENLASSEVINYNRSGTSFEVSAKPGYESLVRNKAARFGNEGTEPWFCPSDIDANISNFIPPSQGENSVIVRYNWKTINIPSKVQSLIDQGLLVVTRPSNPNEEADFEPFYEAKEFVFSGESKIVLVRASNGWIPQESF